MSEELQKTTQQVPPAKAPDWHRAIAEKLTGDLSHINVKLGETELTGDDLTRWIGSNQVAAALAQMHVLLSIDDRLAQLVGLNTPTMLNMEFTSEPIRTSSNLSKGDVA